MSYCPERISRVLFYGRAYNYFFLNNTVRGGTVNFGSRTGIATISGNTYENCSIRISYDGKGVADGLYRKNKGDKVRTPPLVLKNETLRNIAQLDGTYLSFVKSDLSGVNAEAGQDTRLISFVECRIQDSVLRFRQGKESVFVQFRGNQGAFEEKGRGLHRRKMLPMQNKQ